MLINPMDFIHHTSKEISFTYRKHLHLSGESEALRALYVIGLIEKS